jgi:hypothetical protein
MRRRVGLSDRLESMATRYLVERCRFRRVHAGMRVNGAARLGFGPPGTIDGPDTNLPAPQLGGAPPRAFLKAFGMAARRRRLRRRRSGSWRT